MRKDMYVQNDSGGYSLLSSSVVERVIDDARENDGAFVKAHEAILGSLVGDDSFLARVVVGEALSKEEASEWIAHYRWALTVPCGKLLVCGGFDPDVLGSWVEEGEDSRMGGVAVVEVPKGHYLVDVYTYLHTMNGRVILEREWKTKLGQWFREDHPGRAFPSWVAGELAMFHDEDPGHENEWENLRKSVEQGKLKIETDPLDWVSFLFHLQPFDPKAQLTQPEEGDWFGAGQGLRKPERFPLGVPATVKDPEYREALSDLVGEEDGEEEQQASEPVDVLARVQPHAPTPIQGGPVEVSPRQIAQLYRLAWFATSVPHPAVRVRGKNVGNLTGPFEVARGVIATGSGDELRLAWGPPCGAFAALLRLDEIDPDAWTLFPAGSVLELATYPLGDAEPPIGVLRFSGPTRGHMDTSVWQIREAFPPVGAETLEEALALAAASADPKRLALRSPEEAKQVLARFKKQLGFMVDPGNAISVKGAEIQLAEESDSTIPYVALTAFRHRYAQVWPHDSEDEDEDDEDEDDA
jgi:hypothetical protein